MAYNKKEWMKQKEEEKKQWALDAVKEISFHQKGVDEFIDYMDFMAKMYNYSPRNIGMMKEQYPGAHFVASKDKYKELGFDVLDNQKPIKILVPTPVTYINLGDGKKKQLKYASPAERQKVKDKELETTKKTFYSLNDVYDVTQTNARPEDYPKIYPNGRVDFETDNPEMVAGYKEANIAYLKSNGIPVITENYSRNGMGAAKGYYAPSEDIVSLNELNTDTENLQVLIHETAHAVMHKDNSRFTPTPVKEFEAELTAYVVNKHFGIDTKEHSYHYIASWTDNVSNIKDVETSLKNVHAASKQIIDGIEDNLSRVRESEKNIEITNQAELSDAEIEIKVDEKTKQYVDELSNAAIDLMQKHQKSLNEIEHDYLYVRNVWDTEIKTFEAGLEEPAGRAEEIEHDDRMKEKYRELNERLEKEYRYSELIDAYSIVKVVNQDISRLHPERFEQIKGLSEQVDKHLQQNEQADVKSFTFNKSDLDNIRLIEPGEMHEGEVLKSKNMLGQGMDDQDLEKNNPLMAFRDKALLLMEERQMSFNEMTLELSRLDSMKNREIREFEETLDEMYGNSEVDYQRVLSEKEMVKINKKYDREHSYKDLMMAIQTSEMIRMELDLADSPYKEQLNTVERLIEQTKNKEGKEKIRHFSIDREKLDEPSILLEMKNHTHKSYNLNSLKEKAHEVGRKMSPFVKERLDAVGHHVGMDKDNNFKQPVVHLPAEQRVMPLKVLSENLKNDTITARQLEYECFTNKNGALFSGVIDRDAGNTLYEQLKLQSEEQGKLREFNDSIERAKQNSRELNKAKGMERTLAE